MYCCLRLRGLIATLNRTRLKDRVGNIRRVPFGKLLGTHDRHALCIFVPRGQVALLDSERLELDSAR